MAPQTAPIRTRTIRPRDRVALKKLLVDRWGSPDVVSRGKLHPVHRYRGYLAWSGCTVVGYLCYAIRNRRCEIVALEALQQEKGIGTRLLRAAERAARAEECSEVWLITTNDNLRALRFYQRRGFRMRRVYVGAVDLVSRVIKPSIPRIGMHGIPLRDEIEFCRVL